MRITFVAMIAALVVGCGQKHDDHAAKGEKPHDDQSILVLRRTGA